MISLVKKTLTIISMKFRANGPIDLPHFIEITDKIDFKLGQGYLHKLNYQFKSHYPKKKEVIDFNYDWTATTDTNEDLVGENLDLIFNAIVDDRKQYNYFENFNFLREHISGGERIIITRKDGS